MSYQRAIERLNSMVPELHTPGNAPRRKFSLEEFRALLAELGNPQQRFRAVLIAGTNGKGSTAATLASIAHSSGLKTGLYTSPHLVRVNERLRLNGVEISDQVFGELFFQVERAGKKLVELERLPQFPSFFEVLTAMAFCWFASEAVELAVLEVGLGGRLDATNVVDPLVSVITDISLDHTEWLGSTLQAIAGEKAGIVRADGVLVRLPQCDEVDTVLAEVESRLGARCVWANSFLPTAAGEACFSGSTISVESPLVGAHQQRNVALAVATAQELMAMPAYKKISAASVERGIQQTCWPGRMERFSAHGREWLLDVAHNPAGAEALSAALNTVMRYKENSLLVFSCLRDKPLRELATRLFPHFEKVLLTPIHSPRATTLDELEAVAAELGVSWETTSSVSAAIARVEELAPDTVVVSGSVYLVGEFRKLLEENVR